MAVGPLIAIVGQTASGKSALALELASQLNGEIICADSRTIYKGMDIGTAKPSQQDQKHIPHHLLDVIAPGETFTVVDFQKHATQAIEDIHERGKIPFLVGGSGMYIDSILFDYTFSTQNTPRDSANPRHQLREGLQTDRSIRENTMVIGIEVPADELESRIRLRIEKMIDQGLIDEAKQLVQQHGWVIEAMKTYLPLRGFMEGNEQIEEAVQKMIIKDRQLAKKQKTWFRRPIYRNLTAFDLPSLPKIAPNSRAVSHDTPGSSKAILNQRSSSQNQQDLGKMAAGRNKSIQWIKSPQEALQITTDFLNNQP